MKQNFQRKKKKVKTLKQTKHKKEINSVLQVRKSETSYKKLSIKKK